jgi:hypothetical protein
LIDNGRIARYQRRSTPVTKASFSHSVAARPPMVGAVALMTGGVYARGGRGTGFIAAARPWRGGSRVQSLGHDAAWVRHGSAHCPVRRRQGWLGGGRRRDAACGHVERGTDQWARKRHAQEQPGAAHGPMVGSMPRHSGPVGGRGAATRDAGAGGALWTPRVQNISSWHTLIGFISKKLN